MADATLAASAKATGREPLLSFRGFGYAYPGSAANALERISLEIGPGELVVLAGGSGSGKSTLARAAAGLVPHYFGGEASGDARVAGLPLVSSGPGELATEVGYLAQDPETQVLAATVRSELELPLEMRGEAPAARGRAVEEVALALGLAALLDRPTGSLSGGELQRVALASALVLRPRLVVLDEPTSQLDPVAGDELLSLLRRLNEQWGLSILLAEHRLDRCLEAADRIVALDRGQIAFDGPAQAFARWSVREAPRLATPASRLLDALGLAPRTSVKRARDELLARGIAPPERSQPEAAPVRRRRRERADLALDARRARVVLGEQGSESVALAGLSLEVSRGERVALMGRNGAGKSTLMRAAAGLLEAGGGRVRAPAGCALVPQCPLDMFVRERVRDELADERTGAEMLERLGVGWAMDHDPRDLSGGERQRLALALVLAGREPGDVGLVCLDEPTRGLDHEGRQALGELIDGLAAAGTAVLVATHDVEFAAGFADRVALLGKGVVVADGPASEVLSGGWYFSTETARILGAPGAITVEDAVLALGAGGGR